MQLPLAAAAWSTLLLPRVRTHWLLHSADLEVQWLADAGLDVWDARLKEKGILSSLLRRHGLPQRLADALCEEAGVPRDRHEYSTACQRHCAGRVASPGQSTLL